MNIKADYSNANFTWVALVVPCNDMTLELCEYIDEQVHHTSRRTGRVMARGSASARNAIAA